MTVKNNDVEDLYKELQDTLDDDSGEDTPGASAEDDTAEDGAAADDKSDETTEEDGAEDKGDDTAFEDEIEGFTKEEFSKLSARAQKRIRDLAAQKEGKSEDAPDDKEEKKADDVSAEDFNTIEDFLAAVKDEPSRKMLEMFAKVLDKTQSSKIRPLLEKSAGELFEQKFAAFEKIDGMAAHKEDLRKTFMRNPSTDLKALVGAKLVDLQTSKIKPTEKKPSTPSHGGGKVSLDGLSKDELYDQLENLKE